MIIVMKRGASQEDVDHIQKHIVELGYTPHPIVGTERVVIGVIGDDRNKQQAIESLTLHPSVESATPILKPYKRVSAELQRERSRVRVGDAEFGGTQFVVIAGPCSVESEEQLIAAARAVKDAGAQLLRGGAFKPRSSPYSFQGLAEDGLKLLAAAREETGLPIVTEVLNNRDVDTVARYTDMFQIGARNMMNYQLLREVGRIGKPVLVKRGLAATIEEMLMSAEYVADEGNENVVLCERGIRTFETYTRNTLDLAAVPAVHSLSHLPIIVDPSHGTGRRELIGPMVQAAVAVGADGAMVEVHPHPEEAFSDGAQSVTPEAFQQILDVARKYLAIAGRTL